MVVLYGHVFSHPRKAQRRISYNNKVNPTVLYYETLNFLCKRVKSLIKIPSPSLHVPARKGWVLKKRVGRESYDVLSTNRMAKWIFAR